MTGGGWPAHWVADVVLSDGGTVHVRPVRPDDDGRLVALHSRLSPETIHYRFFSPRPRLSDKEVQRFVDVDHDRRVALAAFLHDEMIAVARYDTLPGGPEPEAEVAFVVDDEHQGRGLGTLLLEHLAAAAREREIHRFVAEVLPDNRRMLGVFRRAGWQVKSKFSDGVVSVEFDITPTDEALAVQQEREHRAEARSIGRLLHPASVAVIGASRDPGSIGHAFLRSILDGHFAGEVHVVNPAATEVLGIPAVASVLDIETGVDLAVVVTPPAVVPQVVGECGAKRVRSLVIATADVDPSVTRLAHANGMRVVGPRSMGVVNTDPDVLLEAVVGGGPVVPGPLGLLSQSGSLGIALLEWAGRIGVGISSFVAVGDKSDVSGNDLLQWWTIDERTQVVALYLESFGNPRKFSRLARRLSRSKPVLAVRAGRSEMVDALFRQAGVLRVPTLEALFDAVAVLATQPLPAGPRVAVVASAGGPARMTVDALEANGLVVASVTEVDDVEPAAYGAAAAAGVADEGTDALLLVHVPPLRTSPSEPVSVAVSDAARAAGKPVAAVVLTPAAHMHSAARWLPTFASPEAAAAALGLALAHAERLRRPEGTVPALDVDEAGLRAIVDAAMAPGADEVDLDDDLVDRLLECVGIEVDLPPASGVALRAGVEDDPLFGPLVTLAVAGPAARLIDDHVSRITPLTDLDAADLVSSLRTSAVLFSGIDTAPVQDLLLRLGALVEAAPEVASVELDPVVVAGGTVCVGSARIRLAPEQLHPELARRRLR